MDNQTHMMFHDEDIREEGNRCWKNGSYPGHDCLNAQ